MRILVVEDSPTQIELFYTQVTRIMNGDPWTMLVANTLHEAKESIKSESPDALVLDLDLPDSKQENTLRHIPEFAKVVPVIVWSSTNNTEDLLRCLRLGACNVLHKGSTSTDNIHAAILVAQSYYQTKLISQAVERCDRS